LVGSLTHAERKAGRFGPVPDHRPIGLALSRNQKEEDLSQAKTNDKVAVHYTGKLDDGTVFDSSQGRDPLEFTIGSGQVIPGFEDGVVGMEEGQSKTITLKPDDAYGQVRDDLIVEVNKTDIPKDIDVEVGQQLQINRPDGRVIPVLISAIIDDKVTLDANHPLAGKTLTFDVELVKIS
jgi:peptidylprolyl isomerase